MEDAYDPYEFEDVMGENVQDGNFEIEYDGSRNQITPPDIA